MVLLVMVMVPMPLLSPFPPPLATAAVDDNDPNPSSFDVSSSGTTVTLEPGECREVPGGEIECMGEPEMFGKSYKVATNNNAPKKWTTKRSKEAAKNVWEEVYKAEWQKKKNEWEERFIKLVGKEWEDVKKKNPGRLRERLDQIYWVLFYVWIVLSLLGILVLLQVWEIFKFPLW
jgi:hypothetical protein